MDSFFCHHHDDHAKNKNPYHSWSEIRKTRKRLSEEQMNVVKGVTSMIIAVFSSWVGVFSLLITTLRIIGDVFLSGELRALPHAAFNGLYGFSWRIAFSIGALPMSNSADVFLALSGFILFSASVALGFNALSNFKSRFGASSPFAELL
jgi:hypothetical protein